VRQREQFAEIAKDEWDSSPLSTSRLMIELDRVIGQDAEIVSEEIPEIRSYAAGE
jgi:hypothetical protein